MTKFYIFLITFILFLDNVISNPPKDKANKEKNSVEVNQEKHDKNKTHNIANSAVDEADEIEDAGWEFENITAVDTRRILYSKKSPVGKRPYMVYLQLTKESAKAHKYRGWLCGGVIVSPSYVLTSAACVEDADKFYIVSGTTQYVDSFDYKENECVDKHRRRVIWKCIPKNYKFDFQDSIKWSSNDIAIVKVDRPFKFGVIEKGCEFAADLLCYNNVSRELEKPSTKGWIAGWGSGNTFREGVYRRQKPHVPENAKYLQEAKVCIMDNEQCAKKWAQRFRTIIQEYMICTKDVMKRLSEICDKKYANCTDVETRRNDDVISQEETNDNFDIDLGRHLRNPDDYTARRSSMQGGFCENDHGGPLIVKYEGKERVIGVISACKIDSKTHSCHGPFLYTSIFKNRQFISCAIHKDVESSCRRVFRSGITHEEYTIDWDMSEDDEDDDKTKEDSESEDDDSSDSTDEEDLRAPKEDNTKQQNNNSESSSSEIEETTPKPKKKTKLNKKGNSKKQRAKGGKASEVKIQPKDEKGEVFYESSKDDNVNEPEE